jgi:mannose-6-phosphate isomerase-like protein (cupin superfamily)
MPRVRRYRKIVSGTRIPVPGGKVVEELFGAVHTKTDRFSLARMTAPPGWSEPAQRPEFGELTIMLAGALVVEVDGEPLTLQAGETLWVEPGAHVRYATHGTTPAEYWAICLPAFTPARAHREEEEPTE